MPMEIPDTPAVTEFACVGAGLRRTLLIGRLTGDGRLGVPWRRVLFANVA